MSTAHSSQQPPSRWSRILLCISCFSQGLATAFPWSALVSDQTIQKRHDSHPLRSSFLPIGVFGYLLSNMIFMSANTFIATSAKTDRKVTFTAYAIFCNTFVSLLVITFSNPSANISFIVLVLLFCLSGTASGLIQVNTFALTAKNNRRYSSFVIYGQGTAGILAPLVSLIMNLLAPQPSAASLARSASRATITSTEFTLSVIYYSLSILVLAVGCGFFVRLPKLLENERLRQQELQQTSETQETTNEKIASNSLPTTASRSDELRVVFRAAYPIIIVLYISMCLSLLLYPASTSRVIALEGPLKFKQVFVFMTYIAYTVGDLMGRVFQAHVSDLAQFLVKSLARRESFSFSRAFRVRTLVALSAARWLFPVIFLLTPGTSLKRDMWPTVFTSAPLCLFFIFLLGFSSGAVFTNAFVLAPAMQVEEKFVDRLTGTTVIAKREMTPSEKSLCGRVAIVTVLVGLVSGAALSFGYQALSNRPAAVSPSGN